jgi:hypothetical protein
MGTFTAAQLFALLVSSSVLAALISFIGNHVLSRLQFRGDYFKQIIDRRLHAYEQVDELAGILRLTTYDDRGRIAHAALVNTEIYFKATVVLAAAIGLNLYVSEPIRDALSKISFILVKRPPDPSERDAFELGVTYREKLAELRETLERLVTNDLLHLYKVPRFLKAKRRLLSTPSRWFVAWLPKHGGFSFPDKKS